MLTLFLITKYDVISMSRGLSPSEGAEECMKRNFLDVKKEVESSWVKKPVYKGMGISTEIRERKLISITTHSDLNTPERKTEIENNLNNKKVPEILRDVFKLPERVFIGQEKNEWKIYYGEYGLVVKKETGVLNFYEGEILPVKPLSPQGAKEILNWMRKL